MTAIESGDTIVVTGISSFIGCRLAVRLSERAKSGRAGFTRIVGTVRQDLEQYDELRSSRLRAASEAGCRIVRIDLTDLGAMAETIERLKPAYWIQHAGWATDYGSMTYDLRQANELNVMALEPLYVLLKNIGCRGVIVTGSSAEYSDKNIACREDDPCWPATPYGLAKLAETLRARQLAHLIGLPTRVARVFIPFGPLDAPSKLIPSVMEALLDDRPIDLSPCTQVRDFIHVDDLAEGYAALLDDLRLRPHMPFDLFNLCAGEGTQLRELLLGIAREADRDAALLRFGARQMRLGEAPYSFGTNVKAAKLLGWKPRRLGEALGDYMREPALRRKGGG